jgi:hypothetical protein
MDPVNFNNMVDGMVAMGILGMLGFFAMRMAKMWMEHRQKTKHGLGEGADISAELQQAIQGEFMRLRAENAEFRNKLAEMEKKLNGQMPPIVTPEQQAEIAKILGVQKTQS